MINVLLWLSWILSFLRIRPQHLSLGLSIQSSVYPTFIGYILQIWALCIVWECVFVALYLLIPTIAFNGCLFVVVIFVE